MYSLDEKIMSEDRAIIAISRNKDGIESDLRPGMIAFEHEKKDAYVVAAKETLHRIIKEEIDNKIHGSIIFADDVLIEKNLVVRGDTTKVETVDMVISDNIIELNKDETGAGVSRIKAGIMINRGTEAPYYSIFSETTSRAGLKGYSHIIGETLLSTIYSNGDFWTKGNLDTQSAVVNQDLSVKKNLNVTGNTTVGGKLTVTGTSDFAGDTTFSGAVYMNRTLDVSGNTAIGGTLTVTGAGTFKASSTFKQNLTIENNLYVKKDASVTENLGVGLLATLGSLSVTNGTTLNGALTAKAAATFEEISTFNKDVSMLSNLAVTLKTTSKDVVVNNTLSVKGNSTFTGTTTTAGAATFNGTLTANSTADFKMAVTVGGGTTLKSTLDVLLAKSTFKEIAVNENMSVTKKITSNDIGTNTITTTGLATLAHADVTNGLNVGGNVTCAGTGSFRDISISGTTSVTGSSTFNADALFKKNVTIEKQLNVKENAVIKNLNVTGVLTLSPLQKAVITFNELSTTNTTESLVTDIPNAAVYKMGINGATLATLSQSNLRMNVPVQVNTSKGWGTLLDSATGHKDMHKTGGSDELIPSDIGAIKNHMGVYQIGKGLDNAKGVPNTNGSIYVATDTRMIYASVGNAWEKMSATSWNDIGSKPTTFTPPIATASTLGGIKIGRNLTVAADGTVSIPDIAIEYTVHRKEYITKASNVDTFVTDVEFVPGCNTTSVFVFGKLLPPSAYTEVDGRTIRLREPVALNTHVEIIALVVPSKATFSIKREEFYANAYQKRFVLTRGQYLPKENKVKVYLFGSLLPQSAYKEIDSVTIELNDNLTEGDQVTIEYLSAPEISSRMSTYQTSATSYTPQNEKVFEFSEPITVWTINHNMNTYPAITAIAYNGLKLEPVQCVYQDQNTVHLTFALPVAGRAFVK